MQSPARMSYACSSIHVSPDPPVLPRDDATGAALADGAVVHGPAGRVDRSDGGLRRRRVEEVRLVDVHMCELAVEIGQLARLRLVPDDRDLARVARGDPRP